MMMSLDILESICDQKCEEFAGLNEEFKIEQEDYEDKIQEEWQILNTK
jgi:hypothetical protein